MTPGEPDYHRWKADNGKTRWDLVLWWVIRELAKVLTFGAGKYKAHSWYSVPDARDRYFAALHRHIDEWNSGVKVDPETGLHHLAHAMCNLMFLMGLERPLPVIGGPPQPEEGNGEN